MRLSVQDLSFTYDGQKPALVDVDLSADEGEVLVLLGPNGSGKSTLLKCLANVIDPEKGKILIDGVDVSGIDAVDRARRTGYVPQMERGGFPRTVFDTVLMGRKPHVAWRPSQRDLEFVSSIVHRLGLGHLALRDIGELSGGERQKVLIARALANEPMILLLDEPTANLDLKHQIEVMNEVREQARKGITAVMAVHDLNLALRYADRIILLSHGRVWASGGLETITAENVRSVYGVKVVVEERSGYKTVTPLDE